MKLLPLFLLLLLVVPTVWGEGVETSSSSSSSSSDARKENVETHHRSSSSYRNATVGVDSIELDVRLFRQFVGEWGRGYGNDSRAWSDNTTTRGATVQIGALGNSWSATVALTNSTRTSESSRSQAARTEETHLLLSTSDGERGDVGIRHRVRGDTDICDVLVQGELVVSERGTLCLPEPLGPLLPESARRGARSLLGVLLG